MKQLAFWVFVIGVSISACYAAKLAPVEPGTGSGEEGAVTPMDRLASWWDAAGIPFSVGCILMVGGGLLGRRIDKLASAPSKDRDAAIERAADSPESVMAQIGEALDGLPEGGLAEGTEKAQEDLDRVLEELVPQFLVHRPRLIAELGLEKFATMIGQFASVERNTARAWSALTDGVPSEAEVALVRAKDALVRAQDALSA